MKTKLHLSPFSTNHVSKTFFRSALMTATALLLALGGVKLLAPFASSARHNSSTIPKRHSKRGADGRQSVAQSGQGGASCPTCSQKQRMIYAPLFDLPESSGSEIALNCRSAHDLVITPTFYTLEGEAYTGADVTLKPNEIRFVDTKSLIPKKERNRHKWGGMAFSYVGGFMEAWAQLTLHGIRGGGSVNVLFTVMSQKRSNNVEAVWWTPRGGSAVIALGNSSDQQVRANLRFASGESQFVDVRPFATEIVRLNSNVHSSAAADRVEAVSINYVGPEGSLIPTGYTGSANGKFASMIRFYDARQIVQQHLYATNLRVKDARPLMVLRNVSTDFVTATPAFLPPSGDADQSVKLPPIQLAPSGVVEVDLDPLLKATSDRSDLDSVSVQVLNTGNAGSLIGALYSLNKQTGVTYDVPLRDSGPPRASTGAYSVRFDGDYTTVVAISNTTDKPGDFTMQINYDGGPYVTGIIKVAPGETKTYDIRKLRDDHTPDINGHPLPRNLEMAQVRWSIRGNVRLNGRAEVVSVKDKVSSSYSCFSCCPNKFSYGWIDGPSTAVLPGTTAQFTAWEQDTPSGGQSCGSQPAPYPVGVTTWESDNESVATVTWTADGRGQATAISGGWASISCYWTVNYWEWDDLDESCGGYQENFEPSLGMQVVDVTISQAVNCKDGAAANFSVTATGGTATGYNWTFTTPSGSGNNPNPSFGSPNAASTSAKCRWFASPDRECPATNCVSTYTIRCEVTFDGGQRITRETSLSVDGCWFPAGSVAPPNIAGGPTYGFDTQRNLWVVTGQGGLKREVQSAAVNVPSTSQFYNKAVTHENRHVQQWTSGILSDLFTIQSLMTQLMPLTDASEAGLISKINSTSQTWFDNQGTIYQSRLSSVEKDAYDVSDPVAPKYLYQNCGRYQ